MLNQHVLLQDMVVEGEGCALSRAQERQVDAESSFVFVKGKLLFLLTMCNVRLSEQGKIESLPNSKVCSH